MTSFLLLIAIQIWLVQSFKPYPSHKNFQQRDVPSSLSISLQDLDAETQKVMKTLLTGNPISRIFFNIYDFFYWLPKKNILYDIPYEFYKNSTSQFLSWYQVPHNLPPYRYLGVYHPSDFFCYGLPGNILPLGDWDPWGFQLVSKKVVYKYRFSELKHGRLAMMACLGMIIQEIIHPMHSDIGGLAITHMNQLFEHNKLDQNFVYKLISEPFSLVMRSLAYMSTVITDPIEPTMESFISLKDVNLPLDYLTICIGLSSIEIYSLINHWSRWKRNEYNHQFDHNIGIGNLQHSGDPIEIGNYSFDPLRLMPTHPYDRKAMVERELSHGRFAMIAIVGMLIQEYLTGLPVVRLDLLS